LYFGTSTNVERDLNAAHDLQKKTGQTRVPVIKIGNKWIVGFDQPAIERELARRTVSTNAGYQDYR